MAQQLRARQGAARRSRAGNPAFRGMPQGRQRAAMPGGRAPMGAGTVGIGGGNELDMNNPAIRRRIEMMQRNRAANPRRGNLNRLGQVR